MYYPYDYPSDYYYTPYNLYDYGTGCIRPNSSADLSTFYNTFPYSTSYDQPHPTSYPSFASKNQTKPQELPYQCSPCCPNHISNRKPKSTCKWDHQNCSCMKRKQSYCKNHYYPTLYEKFLRTPYIVPKKKQKKYKEKQNKTLEVQETPIKKQTIVTPPVTQNPEPVVIIREQQQAPPPPPPPPQIISKPPQYIQPQYIQPQYIQPQYIQPQYVQTQSPQILQQRQQIHYETQPEVHHIQQKQIHYETQPEVHHIQQQKIHYETQPEVHIKQRQPLRQSTIVKHETPQKINVIEHPSENSFILPQNKKRDSRNIINIHEIQKQNHNSTFFETPVNNFFTGSFEGLKSNNGENVNTQSRTITNTNTNIINRSTNLRSSNFNQRKGTKKLTITQQQQ